MRVVASITALLFAALPALSGCSPTARDLEKNQSSVRQTKSYPENYQEVYRRLYQTSSSCQSTGGSAAFVVDGQLYNELGYGEITMSMRSIYGSNFYWKAKVEKTGSGSRVSVVSGNTLAKGKTLGFVMSWADGSTKCM